MLTSTFSATAFCRSSDMSQLSQPKPRFGRQKRGESPLSFRLHGSVVPACWDALQGRHAKALGCSDNKPCHKPSPEINGPHRQDPLLQ